MPVGLKFDLSVDNVIYQITPTQCKFLTMGVILLCKGSSLILCLLWFEEGLRFYLSLSKNVYLDLEVNNTG